MTIWVTALIVATLVVIGAAFYLYTTFCKVRILRRCAQATAEEISEVLIYPLYTLDNEMAVNSAKSYVASGRLFGVRLESQATGLLVDEFVQKESIIPEIHRQLYHRGIHLGEVTILLADTEVRSAQQTTLMIIALLVFFILIVNSYLLHILFCRILHSPLKKLIQGVQRFGDSDFKQKIAPLRHEDLNQLVEGLNSMAQRVSDSKGVIVESQKKYSAIFNSCFLAILLCKADGRIVDVNTAAVTMFGAREKQDLIDGLHLCRLVVPERKGRIFLEEWKNMVEGSGSSLGWEAYQLGSTTTFYIELAARKIMLSEPDYIIVSVLDITDRKKAEQQLIQAQKVEAVGFMAGGLAHDFNNVLGGITGHVSLLKLKSKADELEPEELLDSLEKIEESSLRASRVIRQLLTFSKKDTLEVSAVDINDVVCHAVAIIENSLDKSIEINVCYHKGPALVLADATQLEQVVVNLCVNAAHAMTIMRDDDTWGGNMSIEIMDSATDTSFQKVHPEAVHDNYWCVQVSDDGVGIAQDEISRIYLPFYSTKKNTQGAGFGLTVVFNIVKEHDGFIEVSSEAGRGSSFTFFIPKHEKPKKSDTTVFPVSQLEGSGRVLLIDDDELIRSTTKELLKVAGYQVLTASDGAEGLALYSENREEIDIVILDLIMPKMSGKECFLGLRKLDPEVKVILSSGFGQDDKILEMLDAGAVTFLQKPFTIKSLTDILTTHLEPDGLQADFSATCVK
ncbi:MAG: hypothetical protein CSA32_04000 [Desulfobulbus propionicus]|nr:MAG: hypothetical protein CSA32_04000 [Desulfobulbus propionicus]